MQMRNVACTLFSHRTIFWISLIYVLGHVVKTLAAIPNALPPLYVV